MDGKATEAEIQIDPSLVKPDLAAVETDILERPIPNNTARPAGKLATTWGNLK